MRGVERIFGIGPVREDGRTWLSVSDLMSGLMMVFLLISVAQMLAQQEQIEDPVSGERVLCKQLRDELYLPQYTPYNVEIGSGRSADEEDSGLDCLTVRFDDPGVLFESGQTTLQARFRESLDEFFPRYLEILRKWQKEEGNGKIQEVRIEGHTSSDWVDTDDELEAFLKNMALSQGRARSVLQYILNEIVRDGQDNEWVRERVRAVGFSSSQLIRNDEGVEDPIRSRRVLFRVSTNLEEIFRRIPGDGEDCQ